MAGGAEQDTEPSISDGAVLNMTDDAEEYFYNWYNGIIEEVNAIEDDAEVESRKMKLNGNAARLSLVFHVLKWATNGSGAMR